MAGRGGGGRSGFLESGLGEVEGGWSGTMESGITSGDVASEGMGMAGWDGRGCGDAGEGEEEGAGGTGLRAERVWRFRSGGGWWRAEEEEDEEEV